MKVRFIVHLKFLSTNFSCISILNIDIMLRIRRYPAKQERKVDAQQKNIVNAVLLKISLLRTSCF